MKIAILYGWAEGKWHAKKLLPVLMEHNLELCNNPAEADIILCHSGGCYMVPENKAKLFVLIGPPYWPKKSMLLRVVKKTYRDFKMHHTIHELRFWWVKTIHNSFYMFRHLPTWTKMYVNWKTENFPDASSQKVLVIRNTEDKFCQLSGIKKIATERNWNFVELPGEHDDLWIKPNKYVAMIQKELR